MQIKCDKHHLILKDNLVCFWLLGAFFIAAGSFVVLRTAGLINQAEALAPFERLFAVLVGLVSIGAGVYLMHRVPSSRVEFDFMRRVATIKRRRFLLLHVIRLPFEEIYGFAVDEKQDKDERSVYRAAVILDGGQIVPLSELWLNDRAGVKSTIYQVSQTLTAASASK